MEFEMVETIDSADSVENYVPPKFRCNVEDCEQRIDGECSFRFAVFCYTLERGCRQCYCKHHIYK